MRFLLNMNIPRALARALAEHGHSARHAGDIGMAGAADLTIVEEAARSGENIITHDLDYGPLLALSGRAAPSVIILRLRDCRPDNLADQLARALPQVEASLARGAIVVVEDGALRVRDLPVGSSG